MYVCWKSSNNNTSWNISVAFLESCLSISDANEYLTRAVAGGGAGPG